MEQVEVAPAEEPKPEPVAEVFHMPEPVKAEQDEVQWPFESNRDFRKRVTAGRQSDREEQLRLF